MTPPPKKKQSPGGVELGYFLSVVVKFCAVLIKYQFR